MKRLFFILFLLLVIGCAEKTVAPDKVVASIDGTALYVADRGRNELLVLSPDDFAVRKIVPFDNPISCIYPFQEKIIVLTEGVSGKIHFLDTTTFGLLGTAPLGYSPSAVVYNDHTKSLWITQRFNNEVWEIDPSNGEVIAKVSVGREPVAVALAGDGKEVVVANNLPSARADGAAVAANVDVVDCHSKRVVRQIALPNGTTDVKGIIVDPVRDVAYLPHTIARYQLPTNQLDRGWMATSALTIVDLDSAKYVNSVLLDTPQRGAANPWGGVVSGDGKILFLALSGTHEVLSLALPALHDRLTRVAAGEKVTPSTRGWAFLPNDAGFLYGIREFIATQGNGTRSVALCGDRLVGVNYFSADVFALDATDDFLDMDTNPTRQYALKHVTPAVIAAKSLGNAKLGSAVGRGEAYFHDAGLAFQKWQSCATCHPNDARVDGLNWDLLNDGAASLKQTKSLLYAHKTPPSMITGIRKDAQKAVRSGFKYILFANVDEAVCRDVDAYLLSLEALPSPALQNGARSEAAEKGKPLYDRECAGCHGGTYYTDMKSYPVDWATERDRGVAMDTPTLREIWRTAPYLYDGRATNMTEMLSEHTPGLTLTDEERRNLEAYVLTL